MVLGTRSVASVTDATALAAALAGLGLGFSMIVAIGAQNAFVLRQGIRREHVLAVVAICALSDVALISLGIAGTGFVIDAVPWLMTAVRIGGALFLGGYGVLAARRALAPKPQVLEATETRGRPPAVARCSPRSPPASPSPG